MNEINGAGDAQAHPVARDGGAIGTRLDHVLGDVGGDVDGRNRTQIVPNLSHVCGTEDTERRSGRQHRRYRSSRSSHARTGSTNGFAPSGPAIDACAYSLAILCAYNSNGAGVVVPFL